ncbi:MAG: hypothetical protein J0H46_19230 [Bacteroidetes bacterium]|nr:hypothetical protein [Bacteroidota bacterium]
MKTNSFLSKGKSSPLRLFITLLFALLLQQPGKVYAQCIFVTGVDTTTIPPTFHWSDVCTPGVYNYEIQVLRLYNYDTSRKNPRNIYTHIDWSQAISHIYNQGTMGGLGTLSYLALEEGTGYYTWRVRRIGSRDYMGRTDPAQWGPWSSSVSDNIDTSISSRSYHIFYYTQPDDDKNWIYRRTFGDQQHWYFEHSQITNEKKDFANSLLMPIQHQEQMHEDWLKDKKHTIYSETVIDNSGRPSMQTLPAPQTGASMWIQYQNNLFKNSAGIKYKASDFDLNTNYNNPSTASGLYNDYYSDANTDMRIPGADGRPYSRTLYYNDPLNRPREISSPGNAHAPDPLHNTNASTANTIRKFYGRPSPTELLYVMGDEAPNDTAVHKIVTIDPNGTVSTTYTDEFDRTIATCLTPPGSSQLSYAGVDALPITHSDTVKGRTNVAPNTIKLQTSYVFSVPTSLNYLYQLIPRSYGDQCLNLCAMCDYHITLTAHERYDTTMYRVEADTRPDIDTGTFGCKGKTFSITDKYSIPGKTLAPGTYDIGLTLTAKTSDPVTKTVYLDSVVGFMNKKIDQRFNSGGYVLPKTGTSPLRTIDSMRYYATNKNYVALARYLNADTSKSYFQMIFNGLCDTLTLPTVKCKQQKCDTPLFAEYMKNQMQAFDLDNGNTFFANAYTNTTTNGIAYTTDTNNLFIVTSDAEFNNIIKRMVADGYDCNLLWDAWVRVVQVYLSKQVAIVPAGTTQLIATSPKYDWWQEFMETVGYKFPFTRRAHAQLYNASDSVRLKPYKYFPYDWNTNMTAEDAMCYLYNSSHPCTASGNPPTWSSYIYNFPTDPSVQQFHMYNFYTKLKQSNANNSYYVRSAMLATTINSNGNKAQVMAKINTDCRKACDDRMTDLMTKLNDHYINVWATKTEGFNYSPWLPAATDSVTLRQNFCLANSVVATCKNMCDVTPDSSGYLSATKINKITKAMYYDIDVYSHPNTNTYSCAAGYDSVHVIPSSTRAGLLIWLNYMNRRIRDSLTASGTLSYNWTALARAYSLAVSPANSAPCITNTVPMNSTDDISYFEYGKEGIFRNVGCVSKVSLLRKSFDSVLVNTPTNVTLSAIMLDSVATNDSVVVVETIPSSFTFDAGYGTYSGGKMTYTIYGPKRATDTIQIPYTIISSSSPNASVFNGTIYKYTAGIRTDSCKIIDDAIVTANCVGLYYYNKPVGGEGSATPFCSNMCANVDACGGNVCIKWYQPDPPNPDTTVKPVACAELECRNFLTTLDYQIQRVHDNHEYTVRKAYQDSCLSGKPINDMFVNSYDMAHSVFTLYFYDRAGNLIRTVPPAGVVEDNTYTRFTTPIDGYRTEYDYDTRGNVLRQKSADGGETWFYYDKMSRLRFSQNAKQAANNKFSYIKYDSLDRVIETGEAPTSLGDIKTKTEDQVFPISGGFRYVTKTFYTDPYRVTSTGGFPTAFKQFTGPLPDKTFQRNLTNRVSYVVSDTDGSFTTLGDQAITIYSYDAMGDVEYTYQWVYGMAISGTQTPRLIKTESCKITGKIDNIDLLNTDGNPDPKDALTLRYLYTQDGRLSYVFRSHPTEWWRTHDDWDVHGSHSQVIASYLYDLQNTGQVRRMELGDDEQGVDYAYTIEGWLKAINHPDQAQDPGLDMPGINNGAPVEGADGSASSTFRKDLFSEMLNYYTGDFKHTGSVFHTPGNPYFLTGDNLFNGNIASTQSIIHTSGTPSYLEGIQTGFKYHYDQLNRLISTQFHTYSGGMWSATNEYNENFGYDQNGNFTLLNRWANNSNTAMSIIKPEDETQFTYDFQTNRLRRFVDQTITPPAFKNIGDLDDTLNFDYDQTGNLVHHTNTLKANGQKEDVTINWTPQGKIASETMILDSTGTKTRTITYLYDGMGNRVRKKVVATGSPVQTTYYVYTADGKLLASYDDFSYVGGYSISERYLYGLDRVGIMRGPNAVSGGTVSQLASVDFELKDHLGNVRAVFSNNDSVTRPGEPQVRAFYNYYAYGSPQYYRSKNVLSYKFGFNGQEKDNEVLGAGNLNTAMFWEYDTRLGRRWNLDPVDQVYASNYSVLGTNPIWRTDPLGNVDNTYEVDGTTGAYKQIDNKGGDKIDYINVKGGQSNRIGDAEIPGRGDRTYTVNVQTVYDREGKSYGNDYREPGVLHKGTPWSGRAEFVDDPLSFIVAGGLAKSALKSAAYVTEKLFQASAKLAVEEASVQTLEVAKAATSEIKLYGSLTEKFGDGYSTVSMARGPYVDIKYGQKLNAASKGIWQKIFEAGYLDGSKVEVHYFYNSTTGQYANPFIKMSGWGSKAFKNLK